MGVCCHSSDHYGHVGWSRSLAVGYHNDDGGIFLNYSARSLHKGPIWDVGDVVGCLVKVKNTVRTVQFFHKGSKIGKRSCAFIQYKRVFVHPQVQHR
jgi:hypothetical protein